VRLGDAKALRDLVLAQVVEVAETESLALPALKRCQAARDEEAILALAEGLVGARNVGGLAQRDGAACMLGPQRSGHVPIAEI